MIFGRIIYVCTCFTQLGLKNQFNLILAHQEHFDLKYFYMVLIFNSDKIVGILWTFPTFSKYFYRDYF